MKKEQQDSIIETLDRIISVANGINTKMDMLLNVIQQKSKTNVTELDGEIMFRNKDRKNQSL